MSSPTALSRGIESIGLTVREKTAWAKPAEALNALVVGALKTFDPGGSYECPVSGCDWDLTVPVLTLHQDYTRMSFEGVPRAVVERALQRHLDSHTGSEDDPGPTPPSWAEQEWCDGATCEHETCLDEASYEALTS